MDDGRMSGAAQKLTAALGKYRWALGTALLGVLLMLLPGGGRTAKTERASAAEEDAAFDRAAVQREMEEILAGIEGVGRLRLMLTVDSGGERKLAQDTQLGYSGAQSAPQDYERRSQTVVLGTGTDSRVVVTQRVYPRYVGALVVCEGGDSAAVRLAVTEAVGVLTGLSSDRITVLRGRA